MGRLACLEISGQVRGGRAARPLVVPKGSTRSRAEVGCSDQALGAGLQDAVLKSALTICRTQCLRVRLAGERGVGGGDRSYLEAARVSPGLHSDRATRCS